MVRISTLLALAASMVTSRASENYNQSTPVNFAYVLFPAFAHIDVFGPVDALALLSLRNHMNLFYVAETLEPVTTKPSSPAMNRFNSSFGSSIIPTHTFDQPPENIDVLLVPGGLGTRASESDLRSLVAFIRDTYPKVQYLISICTGVGLAARAGVLDGRSATTNKLSWNSTIAHGNETSWKAPARFWVDGNIWSTSGEMAGIDGVLGWIKHVWGEDTAQWVSHGMEHRALEWWEDEFSKIDNVTRTYPCGEAPPGFGPAPECYT